MDDGEVNFDLIEPTGVNWSVDLDRIGIPLCKPFDGRFASVGRTVVGNPEDPGRGTIGFLLHDEVDQTMEGLDPGTAFAQSKEFRSSNIPRGHVRYGPTAFIFKLNASRSARTRWQARVNPLSGLNAGFFIRADHVVLRPQRHTVPDALVQIENGRRFGEEVGIAWENPASKRPRLDGVGVQPAPDGGATDGSHNALLDSLACNVRMTKSRQGESLLTGQFTSESLNLYDNLRGEKRGDVRVVADLGVRPTAHERNVFAIC